MSTTSLLLSVLGNAQAGKRWLAVTPPHLEETAACTNRIVRDARGRRSDDEKYSRAVPATIVRKEGSKHPLMVREAVRLVQEDQNKRRIPIECVFKDDLPTVFVDPIQLQEVFINLISNAIEAMGNSPRKPQVTIRAAVLDDREIAIEVIDNGRSTTSIRSSMPS